MKLTYGELKELKFLMDNIIKVGNSTINYWEAKGWENSNLPEERYIKSKRKEIELAEKFKDKIEKAEFKIEIN